MPCVAKARGKQVALAFPAVPPMSFTPSHALAHVPPFNDVTDNDPCARRIVATSSPLFVDQSSHSLCLFHLFLKLGQGDPTMTPPFVTSP